MLDPVPFHKGIYLIFHIYITSKLYIIFNHNSTPHNVLPLSLVGSSRNFSSLMNMLSYPRDPERIIIFLGDMTTTQVIFPCYQDFGWSVSHTNPNKNTIFSSLSDYKNHQIWLILLYWLILLTNLINNGSAKSIKSIRFLHFNFRPIVSSHGIRLKKWVDVNFPILSPKES